MLRHEPKAYNTTVVNTNLLQLVIKIKIIKENVLTSNKRKDNNVVLCNPVLIR